jgi:AraC-like DNA-binding protein
VEKFLTALLLRNNRRDLITDFALQQITSSNGLVSIEKLSEKTGYSRRYLEMKFAENVGVSPKTLASIKRFQRFYQAWGKFQENRFFEQEIYDYYFDHSHFIKEFKRFTGMAPTKFLKNENEFGRIFYKD